MGIEAHGPWWDEMLSLSSATGSRLSEPIGRADTFTARDFWQGNTLAGVVDAVVHQDGGNAVLYHALLHGWLRVAGHRDLYARLPSAACGVLAVWLAYRLCRLLLVPRVAWWAAAFLAVHPLLVRYGQEARSYALATTLSLAATVVFVRIWRDEQSRPSPARALGYGLLLAASLLSHYLSAAVFAGHGVFALLRVRGKAAWVTLAAAALLAGGLVGGWLAWKGREGLAEMAATNQAYRVRAQDVAPGENFALPTTPRNLAAGVMQLTYAMSGNALQNAGLRLSRMAPLALLPLGFVLAAWYGRNRLEGTPSGLLLVTLLAAGGVAMSALLAGLSGHVIAFQTHYASFATPYFAILMAAGMARAADGWVGRAAVAAQLVVTVLSLKAVYDDAPRFRPPNPYAAIAAAVTEGSEPGTLVVYPTSIDARMVNLYLRPDHPAVQRIDTSAANVVSVLRPGREPLRLPRPSL